MNVITVDFEDWTLDHRGPISDRLAQNVHKVLELFAEFGVRATFFVLGIHAEQAPDLVREIQRAGHDVQSHGYSHQLIHRSSPEAFREDTRRGKGIVEAITGCQVTSYRAPAFTVTRQTLWAIDVLVEMGFTIDSSVFPVQTRRYGIPEAPRFPHVLQTPSGATIHELPLATFALFGRRFPVAGGGYFRLLPYAMLRHGIKQLNAAGHPATIYMHPYEYDPAQFREQRGDVPWRVRLQQGLGRRFFAPRVRRLLADFRFGPACDVVATHGDWTVYRYEPNENRLRIEQIGALA